MPVDDSLQSSPCGTWEYVPSLLQAIVKRRNRRRLSQCLVPHFEPGAASRAARSRTTPKLTSVTWDDNLRAQS